MIWDYNIHPCKICRWRCISNVENLRFLNHKVIAEIDNVCLYLGITSILDVNGGALSSNIRWNNNLIIKDALVSTTKDDNIFVDCTYDDIYFSLDDIDKKYELAVIFNDIDEFNINWILEKSDFVLVPLFYEIMEKFRGEIINISGYLYAIKFHNDSTTTIYQITHKEFREIQDEIYNVISVGEKRPDKPLYYRDDIGDNIAYLNEIINEVTALYWVWKNVNILVR